jgi:beta-galactosidase
MDRRYRLNFAQLPQRTAATTLDILVEATGRINFGQEIHDRKGLQGPVTLMAGTSEAKLTGWKVYNLGLEDAELQTLKWRPGAGTRGPAFWRGEFQLDRAEDTFLDMSSWGKGVVWVNGHCLGRFWNIGPTQTMYLPGPWLKPGRNQVTVLDLLGPAKPVLTGRKQPILNQLRPELDFRVESKLSAGKLQLDAGQLLHSGTFPDSNQPQTVRFEKSGIGRQVAFQMLSAQDGKPFAAIAEFDLLDEAGQLIPRDKWTIAYVDSEELTAENGAAAGAIDGITGQREEFWHSEWSRKQAPYPHCLVIDLGAPARVAGLRYTPRTAPKAGQVKDFRFYIGETLVLPAQ